MKNKIKKLIIPAAGLGTRMLPLTRVVYKELIPILNKPLIQYLVEEAISSGIEEIIFVLSKRKLNIYKYFDLQEKQQDHYHNNHKVESLKDILDINKKVNIKVVMQKEQLGLAHAIQVGSKDFQEEPFAVILGDDLIQNKKPAINQLIESYYKEQTSVIGVQKLSIEEASNYGVLVNKKDINKNTFEVKSAVEKPVKPPSKNCVVGRYVFSKQANILLRKYDFKNQNFNLLDMFNKLIEKESVKGFFVEGKRYDLGSVEGLVKANIDYSLQNENISSNIKKHIEKIVSK